MTGDVYLVAQDVGALSDDTPIPVALADLASDATHRTVTDTEKATWNAKQNAIPENTYDAYGSAASVQGNLETAVQTLNGSIGAINGKIPAQATSQNQLADKDFVNSTINSVSAFPISCNADGDGFPTISSLLNAQIYYSGGAVRVPTTNDYAFVTADTSKATEVSGYDSFTTTDQYVGYYVMYNDTVTLVTSDNKDSVGITAGTTVAYVAVPSSRYVYSIPTGQTSGAWNFQTIVTPLSFTAVQVKALNSNVTAARVSAYDTHTSNSGIHVTSSDKTNWDGKQNSNLGVAHAGEFLVVGSDGMITSKTMTAWEGGNY